MRFEILGVGEVGNRPEKEKRLKEKRCQAKKIEFPPQSPLWVYKKKREK